jgi:hypothetical protein
MAGLLIRVAEPAALQRVAEAWGLRQSVTEEDARAVLDLWAGDELVTADDV